MKTKYLRERIDEITTFYPWRIQVNTYLFGKKTRKSGVIDPETG